MKKLIATLACSAVIASSLTSCNMIDVLRNAYQDALSQTDTQTPQPEAERMHPYYNIENVARHTDRYTIYDIEGNAVYSEDLKYFFNLSMIGEYIVDICIDMGKGVYIHKYYDVKNNRLSKEYSDIIASTENLVAYWDFAAGNSPKECELVVRDIFDETVFYKSFELETEWAKYHVKSARFTEGEIDLEFTYRVSVGFTSSTTYPIRRPVEQEELIKRQETAMIAYSAVLKNDLPVYEVNGTTVEPACRLKDLKVSCSGIPLSEIEELKCFYMDVDGDLVNEFVIDCGDILILRYYQWTMYVYRFTTADMCNLNTDGSYNWTQTGEDFEYGEGRLFFDGVEMKFQTTWRVVNDGEAYYIEDREVSQTEFENYIGNNPKTPVAFESLQTTWKDEIPEEEALMVAQKYIKDTYGDKREYTFTPVFGWDPNYSAYVFYVTADPEFITDIWIDKYTGEVITIAAKG